VRPGSAPCGAGRSTSPPAAAWIGLITAGAPTAYERQGLSGQIDNARQIADQFVTLLIQVLWPFTDWRRDVGVLIIVALVAAGLVAWRRGPAVTSSRARLWLAVWAGGLVVAMLGYLPFVPADPAQYQPLLQGGQNRVNMAASPGYALVLVALAGLTGTLVAWAARERARVVLVVQLLLVGLIGAGLVADAREHVDAWDRSWTRQQQVLAGIQALVPEPAADQQFLTFGHAGAEQFGVPLLGGQVDVTHALRLTYGNSALEGAAVLQGTTVKCGADALELEGNAAGGFRAEYRRAVFVDVATQRRAAVRDRRACERAASTFTYGPVFRLLQ
jgi:hypothetical protein